MFEKNKEKSKKAAFGECFAEWWRIFCANQVLDAALMTWINLPWRPLEAQLKAFELFALETNVCKQIKLMQKVLKWVAFLLLNFQNRNKRNRQKPNWSIKWTRQARSSIFIACIGSRVWTALSLPNRKLFLVTRSMTNDLCGKTDQLVPEDGFSVFGSLDSKQLWRNRRRVSRQFCVSSAIPCISKAVLMMAAIYFGNKGHAVKTRKN